MISKNKNRDIHRAELELKNNRLDKIKTNTNLFKEVMQEIGVDYL
jgi:hypothetical protein